MEDHGVKEEGENDKEEEEEDDKDVEEDKDEDDANEPQRIGQGQKVYTSADDIHTMVDDQPIVLPEQGQEMCKDTPWPQPLAPAPRQHTMEPCPPPRTLETHLFTGLDHLALVTSQNISW
jgi:hypothetical protein